MLKTVINILIALLLGWMACCDATPLPIPPEMDYEVLTLKDDPDQAGNVLFDGPAGTADTRYRFTIQDISSFDAPMEVSLRPDGSFDLSMAGTLADNYRVRVLHRSNWIHLFDCHSADLDRVALLADQDADGDGYVVVRDCNDENPSVHPGATEQCGDRVDNDCDGLVDEDCP
jgi:hypothetical protein